MAPERNGLSFYFFDFDDNLMFLGTKIFIRNTETKQERGVTTREFASIQSLLGRPGPWEEFMLFDGSFREFRDVPPESLAPDTVQRFIADVEQAVISSETGWQGPSWKFFVYACKHQRPVSIVTARGHSRETLQAGIQVLVDRKLIPCAPFYHTIYPVGNDEVRRELGDEALEFTTPALKRRAILKTVDMAFEQYGTSKPLRFGMSDDDPLNVNLIIRAMCECKKRYRDGQFFVINTQLNEEVKLEVLPMES